MGTKRAVANRIHELCEQHGLTINALADNSGISPSTVYSILNQKSKNPGIITIKKICDGLDITLADFFESKHFDGIEQEIR
ncbi:MAG: helix-turn-helix transcriptional regulator [Clostridiales bacterium]|nr:helix-turn-helix transcriptional regulator [Clostridiales bacterium]